VYSLLGVLALKRLIIVLTINIFTVEKIRMFIVFVKRYNIMLLATQLI